MFTKRFVFPYEALLEYLPDGSVVVLGPGRHRTRRGATYVPVDLRIERFVLPTQEIQVVDGGEVRVSAAVDVRVADPVAFANVATDPHSVVYLAVQVAIRNVVAELSVDDVLARRFDLTGVRPELERAAASVGLAIVDVVIRDVGVPADLERARRAAVIAEAGAKAELERARADAAALRVRANAAALLERNPVLARIRTLEAVPPGAQIVMHLGSTADTDERVSSTGA